MSSEINSGRRRSSTRRAHTGYSEVNYNIYELPSLSTISALQSRAKGRLPLNPTQEKRHRASRRSNSRKVEAKSIQAHVRTNRAALHTGDSSIVRDSISRRKPPVKPSTAYSSHAQQAANPHHKNAKESDANNPRNTVRKEHQRPPGILSVFFNTPHPQPVKKVTCITCLSDDIPITKSAKLTCSHRMCYACLRRIFKLSITDPQHMPPRCCTQDPIPTKYVEIIFDQNFKMKWYQKYKEYTTKNRYYCPSKSCGEWIQPSHIFKDRDGNRIYGKCPRCKKKVCCLCRGKWHGNKNECPKDETVQRLEKMARENGWQRCYNCSSYVELKEGCNHMTCRCNAQFCMICGSKWKTCDCPWFNYDTTGGGGRGIGIENWVDDDDNDGDGDERHPAVQANHGMANYLPDNFMNQFLLGRPALRYQDELGMRRQQEWRDLDLARRLQRLEMDDEDD